MGGGDDGWGSHLIHIHACMLHYKIKTKMWEVSQGEYILPAPLGLPSHVM